MNQTVKIAVSVSPNGTPFRFFEMDLIGKIHNSYPGVEVEIKKGGVTVDCGFCDPVEAWDRLQKIFGKNITMFRVS